MIYFVQASTGLIKIGCTSNVATRLSALRCGSAVPLSLLGLMDGGRAHESSLHSRFASARVYGEWFRPDADLVAFVALHARSVPENEVPLERDPPPTKPTGHEVVELGGRIRKARQRRRLTASDVAERSGMAKSTYVRLERGDQSLAIGKVVAVLRVLDMLDGFARVATGDERECEVGDRHLPQRVRTRSIGGSRGAA